MVTCKIITSVVKKWVEFNINRTLNTNIGLNLVSQLGGNNLQMDIQDQNNFY